MKQGAGNVTEMINDKLGRLTRKQCKHERVFKW